MVWCAFKPAACASAVLLLVASGVQPARAADPGSATVTPQASPTPVPVSEALGHLDALAQAIVSAPAHSAAAQSRVTVIVHGWPTVRSRLVAAHAKRSDLVAADTALRLLSSENTDGADLRRAANGLTAAFAPLYAAAGDLVPPRVHRLDFIGRSIGLDVLDGNWVRANVDLVAARTSWQNAESSVRAAGGKSQAAALTERLGAVEDAVGARNVERAKVALASFDRGVAGVETVFDHQEPAWRRWFRKVLGV